MASLPEFIQAGMDFFSGKTVLASTLAEANEKLNAANLRISELEKIAGEKAKLEVLNGGLQFQIEEKTKELEQANQTISTLQANYQTASRQAQIQVTKIGAQAPVATPTEIPADAKTGEPGDKFRAAVAAKMESQKVSKGAAIALVMKENPAAYSEWLKGDTSKI